MEDNDRDCKKSEPSIERAARIAGVSVREWVLGGLGYIHEH